MFLKRIIKKLQSPILLLMLILLIVPNIIFLSQLCHAVSDVKGRIVFAASDYGSDGLEIFVVNDDGTGLIQLTDNSVQDFRPSWSPDGKKIVFSSNRTGNLEIFVMDYDGGNPIQLTSSPENDFHPRWSPYGNKLVFVRQEIYDPPFYLPEPLIYIMNSDGSNVTRLDVGKGNYPDWSPDGEKIVFSKEWDPDDTTEIYVTDKEGYDLIRLTSKSGHNSEPSWSPDGEKIIFSRFRIDEIEDLGDIQIFIMDVDGTDVVKLTNEKSNHNPRWSSDGNRIAFLRGSMLYIMNNDGSNITPLFEIRASGGMDWHLTTDSSQEHIPSMTQTETTSDSPKTTPHIESPTPLTSTSTTVPPTFTEETDYTPYYIIATAIMIAGVLVALAIYRKK